MASVSCFNCGDRSHISLRCPTAPLYTRCFSCKNVCFSEDGHKRMCENKGFRSVFIGDDVTEISEFLRLDFLRVNEVFLVSSRGLKEINRAPLWLANLNIQLRRINGGIRFEAANQRTLTVAIIDRHMKRRLKMSVGDHLVINDYYDFSSTGLVKYNRAYAQNELGPSDVTLQYVPRTFALEWNVQLFRYLSRWHCIA